jgi:hypothetical protein
MLIVYSFVILRKNMGPLEAAVPSNVISLYAFFWAIPRRLKIQKPWKYPEENTQHTEHGASLKSRIM